MSSKTLVYPFDQQFLPIIETKKYPPNLEITFCVSPKGWGFAGKDIGYVAYAEHRGIQVVDDFEAALAEVDVVIFSTYQKYIDREKSVLPRIQKAIANRKNIYCCLPLSGSEYGKFSEESAKYGANFVYFGNECLDVSLPIDHILRQKRLQPIATPVVAIASLTEFSGKFSLQLKFAQYMREQGYKVSLITSKSYSAFVQEHPVPSFLFSNSFSELDKIFMFNGYVKYIQDTENPDLIVISIPGGLLPVNSADSSWFGITAYEITRAVTPDASFLVSYFENFELSHIDEIVTMFNHRFSLNVNAVIFNNIMIEFAEETNISYIDSDAMGLGEADGELSVPIFGVHNINESFSYMLSTLSQYSDIATL